MVALTIGDHGQTIVPSIAKIVTNGLTEGIKEGLVHSLLTQLFQKQGMGKWETKLAVQGAVAASIASASLPVALFYIALSNLPNNRFSYWLSTISSAASLASASSVNIMVASLTRMFGFELANNLVDAIVNLIAVDDQEINNQRTSQFREKHCSMPY